MLTKKYKLLTKNTRQKEESNEVPYNENIFSCIEYDSEGNEKNKLIRNYSPNGEWETIFYHNGKPYRKKRMYYSRKLVYLQALKS